MSRRNQQGHYRRYRRTPNTRQGNGLTSAFRTPKSQMIVLAVVALVIVLLVLWGNSRAGRNNPPAGLPPEISASEAYAKYQGGAFLLDVRTQEEWNDFHAPNTTLIPLDQLPSRLNELPRDKEIVVVCRSGNRSQQGRDILLNAGFQQVTSMQGGLNEWRASGYPVEQ
jgi:rhodanese-related sulfurtransferase